ncbi:unnamed protein product [Phytophthora fragariaefolia]|uniref:Unnamed protein product n=1 Tax=Phytophthora fragariaefolia TaxID=1490495 RepID=A0A9W7D3S6_9STRA|nr:unnamed protein product [Phytophthora fragariaefolia]
MLTRSRSKAENQPVFIDDKWNDAYIQTKDEQIDAMLAADASQRGWDELGEENSDAEPDDDDDDDAWHSSSDESEDNDDDWLERPRAPTPPLSFAQRWLAGGGLLQNAGWTLAAAAVAPLLLYASLPRADGQLWPLRSPRLAGTLAKVLLNLLTLAAAAAALYGASCCLEPLSLSSAVHWRQLELEPPAQCADRLLQGGREFVHAVMEALGFGSNPSAPLRRLDDDIWTLVASLDAPVLRELAGLLAGALLTLTCFHRLWAKTVVLLTAAGYLAFNVMTEVKMQQRAAVEIYSLDPTFAFVNESIFVSICWELTFEAGRC